MGDKRLSGILGHPWELRPDWTGAVGQGRRLNERTGCQELVSDQAEAEKEADRMPQGSLAGLPAAAGHGLRLTALSLLTLLRKGEASLIG